MCNSCETVGINGVLCHETGCPEAFKDQERECKECDAQFKPKESHHEHCSPQCYAIYHGLPFDEETDDG